MSRPGIIDGTWAFAIGGLLAVGATGCMATDDPEQTNDVAIPGAAAALVKDAAVMWPLEATARWTFQNQTTAASTTVTVAPTADGFQLSGFPGIGAVLPLRNTRNVVQIAGGGVWTTLFQLGEGPTVARTLPSNVPAGLARSRVAAIDTSYSIYNHLNGRNFVNCARYGFTPLGDGITEIVLAPNVGPVMVKVRVAGAEQWWFLATATTATASVTTPTAPTIPPRTAANLLPRPAPSPSSPPGATTLDGMLAELDHDFAQDVATDAARFTRFHTESVAGGLLEPTESLGEVLNTALEVDDGPPEWPADVLLRYPNIAAQTAKNDELATLNNQIADAVAEASLYDADIGIARELKRDTLKEIKREAFLSLALEQAAYRREITTLWVEFGLEVVATVVTAGAATVTRQVVSRMVRPVGSNLRRLARLRMQRDAVNETLQMIRPGSPLTPATRWAIHAHTTLTNGILWSEMKREYHVQCVRRAGLATGAIVAGGEVLRRLAPNENNPHEVIIAELEQTITVLNQHIADARAKRDAAFDRARAFQVAYRDRAAAP